MFIHTRVLLIIWIFIYSCEICLSIWSVTHRHCPKLETRGASTPSIHTDFAKRWGLNLYWWSRLKTRAGSEGFSSTCTISEMRTNSFVGMHGSTATDFTWHLGKTILAVLHIHGIESEAKPQGHIHSSCFGLIFIFFLYCSRGMSLVFQYCQVMGSIFTF